THTRVSRRQLQTSHAMQRAKRSDAPRLAQNRNDGKRSYVSRLGNRAVCDRYSGLRERVAWHFSVPVLSSKDRLARGQNVWEAGKVDAWLQSEAGGTAKNAALLLSLRAQSRRISAIESGEL